jgi:hypothetical protein
MKTNGLIVIIAIAIIAMGSSCNTELKEVNERLEKQVDSLNALLHQRESKSLFLDQKSAKANLIDPDSKPIDSVTAKKFTKDFRNSGNDLFRIPVSWEFRKDHIASLVKMTGAESIRLYAVIRPDTNAHTDKQAALSLIAVAVDKNDNDIITIKSGEETITGMYEFASPCPTKCGKQNSVLNPIDVQYCYHYFKRSVPDGYAHGQRHGNPVETYFSYHLFPKD